MKICSKNMHQLRQVSAYEQLLVSNLSWFLLGFDSLRCSVAPCFKGFVVLLTKTGTFYAVTLPVPATTPVGFLLRAFLF